MAVATGISPDVLVELDGSMYDALDRALSRRWSPALELQAETLEVLHGLLTAFVAVHSKPGAPPLPPLRVPRPDHVRDQPAEEPVVQHMGLTGFAEMFTGSVTGVGRG